VPMRAHVCHRLRLRTLRGGGSAIARPPALTAVLILGLLAMSLGAEAQQPKLPRIGYLSLAPGPSPRSEALRQGLHDLGYVEGQNIVIEYRWAEGSLDRARQAASDLVRLKVDIIVTGGPQTTLAAKEARSTTPIVMAVDYDPVSAGFVASLARPGGNITGLSAINPELSGKRLDLLKQAVPRLSRAAVLWNPAEPNGQTFLRETQVAGARLGIQLQALEVRAAPDLEAALQAARKGGANGLAVLTDPVTLYHRKQLADLAAKHRLPAIYSERLFVEAGGLMSYGANDREMHRRAAVFVDKILKGANPGELPVEQPNTYELVINLRAARALALTIPPSLLTRSDHVVE
jgi:putative tryptophan/tyrosine transport system substrate-binding protein